MYGWPNYLVLRLCLSVVRYRSLKCGMTGWKELGVVQASHAAPPHKPARWSLSAELTSICVLQHPNPTTSLSCDISPTHETVYDIGAEWASKLDVCLYNFIMINAFLVFNGQGQPRLTKFYTQLVGSPDDTSNISCSTELFSFTDRGFISSPGNEHPATSNIRNLHTRLESPLGLL